MAEPPAPPATHHFSTTAPSGIYAARWRTCSAVLSETRRLRALAADIRVAARDLDVDAQAGAAVDEFATWLDAAAARGDVAAELVLRHAD